MPVMVTEGGWNLRDGRQRRHVSPQLQRRYIVRQAALLDAVHATAVFQLMFTDLDLISLSEPPAGSILPLFASIGLVDVNLTPKPALAVWDSLYALSRHF